MIRSNLMRLVLALEEEEVLPKLDSEGAMYALEELQALQENGWQFVPPEDEEVK